MHKIFVGIFGILLIFTKTSMGGIFDIIGDNSEPSDTDTSSTSEGADNLAGVAQDTNTPLPTPPLKT